MACRCGLLAGAAPVEAAGRAAEAAPPRFHARHDAVSRSYLYQIARRRTAFAKPFVWWIKDLAQHDPLFPWLEHQLDRLTSLKPSRRARSSRPARP